MTVDEILGAFERATGRPAARTGPGAWRLMCPGHDDHQPSLDMKATTDRMLLVCRSRGCHRDLDRLLAHANMRPADLFLNGHDTGPAAASGRRIVATYDYTDGAGARRYQTVRYDPKDFRQRRPDEAGGWAWNLDGVARVLYRMPELIEAERVYWVEGEKDADELAARGLAATTTCGGAGAVDKGDYAAQLDRVLVGKREVILLRDNDPAGLAYRDARAAACAAFDLTVKCVELPGVAPKGDVSDWLAQGGTAEALVALADAAPVWSPEPDRPVKNSGSAPTISRVQFRSGSALDATPLTYVVEEMLPAGMLSALGGRDGMGKSLLGMQIIKCVLTGEKLFGRFAVQQGTVYALFLDDPEFLVRERLEALGILDHPQLHVATENDVDMTDPKAMLTSLIALLKTAEPRPTFVFVDALYLFIPSGGASDQGNSAGAMAPVIEAFNQVTRETGSALLLVAHDNKAGSDIAGSYAIRAGLKSILRLLFPPAIAKQVAKGDEGARETPERMLQLNKLKTGRPGSWYLRLGGAGAWTFHGGAQAYRKATLPGRVLESLWGGGDSTVEEIAKDLHARPVEVRAACLSLYLDDRITRGERPREDGKPGRGATIYGPKAPANGDGTDRSERGGTENNGTDSFGGKATEKQVDDAIPNLSVPFDPPTRAREAIRPAIPTEGPKPLSVRESPEPDSGDGPGERLLRSSPAGGPAAAELPF